ncbi:ATP phosphoribosyltransferase regulatory subunit [Mediterraneibacter glycyrrhizinilyticus]|uniref:ATP phosphoribosyltransferase regulatory subunit n=1 Tax=Mediterraneibacter glycyrrhizinilyticus TaxID=342942 RepID=UPI00195FF3A7|nr:ATP phosphoribosyltransferase regulatory subunit [Mediterraneibacter glycyrrhizinilyticus]MBM6750519.1 ATP phosphoribosyltransferase regulatory subunit [Mediterraneibacter glycyrrhizinilyticus]HJC91142.1 ATP phosphoribosyltransferase regulatory subunit [Candidatus Mediterraneibacter excrementigallinarum]
MEQKLHTPEGVRDIYNRECETKLTLQQKLSTVLHLYGYQDIQTPTFEYDDVFRKEIGSTSTKELYRFFDREGNILALRPDITPSVARAAATLFEGEDLPIRLCYIGNTFINHSSYQGRLKENTQMGAELIGLDSVEADAEMIAMVVDGLKKTGLTEFQVNIGHIDFIQSLLESTGLEEEEKEEIRELITNRNYFGVEEILDNRSVKGSVKDAFRILPELVGGQEVLERAARIAPSANARLALTRLQQIYRLLMIYKAEDHVTFDLSMMGSYGYYTGIIFRAYTYGTGDAVVRGGRYDHLLEKFGKSTPSIGFAIIVDELMSALSRQKISVETSHRNLLVYTEETQRWAIFLARDFRDKGKNIEMIKRDQEDRREKYEKYGKRNGIISMLYLRDDFKIEMVNLRTGEEKIIDAKKKRR